jgi:uncharacterized protein (TIGR02217 family)
MTTEVLGARFPEDVGRGARGGPGYRTEVAEFEGGGERRNGAWLLPRHRYNVAYGVKTTDNLETVLALFHVARGRLRAFRFKDWGDYRSGSALATPSANDQTLGTGDDAETDFQLIKRYTAGAEELLRPITRPVAGSVLVALDGAPQGSGWSVDVETGLVTFDTAPTAGILVSAGFAFDVLVRFEADELPLELECYRVGSVEVGLVEVRE